MRKKISLLILLSAVISLALVGVDSSFAAAPNKYVLPENPSTASYAFKRGNSVYLVLNPYGLGGYMFAPIHIKLLEVSTADGQIRDLVPAAKGNFGSYYYAAAQNRFVYVTQKTISILDLKSRKNVWDFTRPPEIASSDCQITAIKSSANGKTIQFIIMYGPDDEHSVYYTLDVKTKKLTKGKTVDGIVSKF